MKNRLKKKKIIAIIPGRGSSSGLPKKNSMPLSGKPLLAYTIEEALKSKYLQRVVISTDDEEIAKIANACGGEVPFFRPVELAQDDSPTLPGLQHAVRYLEEKQNYKPDIIATLQPTSPLRKAEHIDKAIERLIETGADSVVSLCEAEHSPYWMKRVEGDRAFDFMEGSEEYTRRQDLPEVYRINGAIYITRYEVLIDENKVLGADTRAIIMSQEDSIDINTELDFKLAELVLLGRRSCEKS